jgi:predicted aspartyl protease/tetratricopeptide (TPR) repeat protein
MKLGRPLSVLMLALMPCGALVAHARESSVRGCTLQKLAELPVTMAGLRPLVPVTLDGARLSLLLDSGAFYSMLTPETASRLGLALGPAPFGLRVGGVGGAAPVQAATVASFGFADVALKDVQFIVGGSTPGAGAAGILGQNVLRIADVEYDFADGVTRLMRPVHCGHASLAYWARSLPVSTLDIAPTSAGAPWAVMTARLNGRRISVMLDSGASTSLLTLSAARRAGITPQSAGVTGAGAVMGVGHSLVMTWRIPIDELQIGDERIRHTHILMGDVPGDFDLLLGTDFLLSHRIYVSNSQHRMYFTYNGGPVFNVLSAPPSASASVKPSAPTMEPADAAALSRRGDALAARRDYAEALTYLSRACELAPTMPVYFYQRGLIYLQLAQPRRALEDFGRVIALSPHDVAARVARATVRLEDYSAGTAPIAAQADTSAPPVGVASGAPQIAAALEDLDFADRDAAAQADIRLRLADLYTRAGRLPEAIHQYDLWTAAHAGDARLPDALNASCWERALLGSQLGRALANCRAALRLSSQRGPILRSRGLVRLRLGQYKASIADFSAALKAMPRSAWSLYGRGWDESHLGMSAAAHQDIQAALVRSPRIAAQAGAYGLVP